MYKCCRIDTFTAGMSNQRLFTKCVLWAPWQNCPYKNKHTELHTNTQNTKTQQTFRKKTTFCVFRILQFLFYIYDFLNDFSKKYWGTSLVRSMTFNGGLKLVWRYSKPYTLSYNFEWIICISAAKLRFYGVILTTEI